MRQSLGVLKFTFLFVLIFVHTVPNWGPTSVVKHGAKFFVMLMGNENTIYKGKIVHVHRKKNNHISKNQNN
jgi:hypothetical protein